MFKFPVSAKSAVKLLARRPEVKLPLIYASIFAEIRREIPRGPAKKPVLNRSETIRRFRETLIAINVYVYLHTHPGATIHHIMEDMKLSYENAEMTLSDLRWAGMILFDKKYRFFPVPLPLAPLLFLSQYLPHFYL